MTPFLQIFEKGGWVMIAIAALSVVLYSRCFQLLLSLRRSGKIIREVTERGAEPEALRAMREDVHDTVRHQRLLLSAMIGAAPLLGLLGTVRGMEITFASLSGRAGDKSMEGLARGISEVLLATESGLAVAIPALLLVYLAHRQSHRVVESITSLEHSDRTKDTA